MASYEIVIADSAVKELERIPRRYRAKIVQRIRALGQDPRPLSCQKLAERERYRIRQGPYRVIYQIIEKTRIIDVVKVGHRREVYR